MRTVILISAASAISQNILVGAAAIEDMAGSILRQKETGNDFLVPGKGDISNLIPDLMNQVPANSLVPALNKLLGHRAICPTDQLGPDCLKHCELSLTATNNCGGVRMCECQQLTQTDILAAFGNCLECHRLHKDGKIKLDVSGSQIFKNPDVFNKVVQDQVFDVVQGCGATVDRHPKCPQIGGTGADLRRRAPNPAEVTQWRYVQGKVTKVRTVAAPKPPPRVVQVTKHYTRPRNPNACYGPDCIKTITGYHTTTRFITIPARTITGPPRIITSTYTPPRGPPVVVTVTKPGTAVAVQSAVEMPKEFIAEFTSVIPADAPVPHNAQVVPEVDDEQQGDGLYADGVDDIGAAQGYQPQRRHAH